MAVASWLSKYGITDNSSSPTPLNNGVASPEPVNLPSKPSWLSKYQTFTPNPITPNEPTPATTGFPVESMVGGPVYPVLDQNPIGKFLNQIASTVKGFFTPAKTATPIPIKNVPENIVAPKLSLDLSQPTMTPSATLKGNNLVDQTFKPIDPIGSLYEGVYNLLGSNKPGSINSAIYNAENKFIVSSPVLNNRFTQDVLRSTVQSTLNFSPSVEDALKQQLPVTQPKNAGEAVIDTVGNGIGQAVALVGAGKVLKAVGLTKMILPITFGVIGQLETSAREDIAKRIEKIPVDVTAGWLFSKIPGSEKLLSKQTVIGAGASGTALSGLGFIQALTQGMQPEEAAKLIPSLFITGALFHTAATGVGLGVNKAVKSNIREGSIEFTPQQARETVTGSNLENTPAGNAIIKASMDAEAQGKNIKIDGAAAQKSAIAKALNLKTPEGVALNISIVEPTTPQAAKIEAPVSPDNAPVETTPTQPITPEQITNLAKPLGVDVPETFKSPVEEKAYQSLVTNPDQLVQQYINKFDNHVNADNAKQIFPDYNGTNAMEFDKVGGNLAKLVYNDLLTQHEGDTNKTILFSAGGTGSGKSTAIKGLKDYSIKFDSNLNNFENAKRNIDNAVSKGYQVDIRYVYRDPSQAFTQGVLKRYQLGEPRTVPVDTHINAHVNARDNILKLAEEYKNNPNVDIKFFDNSGTLKDIKAITLENVAAKTYNKAALRKELTDYANKLKESGILTKDQLSALTGSNGAEVPTQPQTGNSQGQPETKTNPESVTTPSEKDVTKEVKAPSGIADQGGNPIGSFEKVEPNQSEAENFKLHDHVKALIDKYAKLVGEGYLSRGAAGQYYPDTKSIRVNGMNNLSTAAHEIAHFLDFQYKISDVLVSRKGDTLALRKEITSLYSNYYGGGGKNPQDSLQKKATEGFATLLQKYIEMPTTITNEFPELVKEFLTPGGKYYQPVMGEIIKDLKKIVADYQGLSALDKVGARVTSENTNIDKSSFLSFADKFRTWTVDNIYPLEVLARKGGLGGTIKDPSLWIRQYSSIPAIITSNMNGTKGFWNLNEEGNFEKTLDHNWKSLITGLEKEKQTDSFGHYLIARDQFFNWKELDKLKTELQRYEPILKFVEKIGFDLKDKEQVKQLTELAGVDATELRNFLNSAKQAKADYEQQRKILTNNGFLREEVTAAYLENNTRWVKEEELFDKLTKETLKLLHNPLVQLVNKDTFDKLSSKQGYASMKRQFYDELAGEDVFGAGVVRVGKTRVSSMLSRSGSQRAIINPLYSGVVNYSEALRKSMRQIVYNKMGEIGISAAFPDLFQKLQLEVSVDRNGRISYPQEKDPHIVMARSGYKRVPIETDNLVKKVLDEVLTYQNIGGFEQLVLGTNRLFTKGTTGAFVGFSFSNFFVDQTAASAQTRNKYIPIYSALRELSQVVLKKTSAEAGYFEEYMVLGGEKQTLVGWQNMSPNELFKTIREERSGLEKVVGLLDKGMDILTLPGKYSEIASRATEYIKARKAGKPQIVAFEDAGRVTAPFHHVGSFGGSKAAKLWVKSIPFFNPGIQVLDQTLRSINDTPESRRRWLFVVLAVTAAMVGSFGLYMATASDDQKNLWKDLQPNELGMYIFIPNPNKKDLIRIRIPQELGAFGTIINMILADRMFNAQYKVGDYIQGGNSFLPQQLDISDPTKMVISWIPQILKPAIEVAFGVRDFPKAMPIVPQSLQSLPTELQYNQTTTALAKTLGKWLDISPMKIDYLITGYAGRASGYLTGKPGVYNPIASLSQSYYFTSGRRIQNYYDMKTKNDQEFKALKDGDINYSAAQKNEIIKTKATLIPIDKYLSAYRNIDETKDPVQAAAFRNKILFLIDGLKK